MFIEPKITYSEFMLDNPTFWDERISDGDIDEATVNSIFKWFKHRIVCDDFRFDDYFDRQLDLVLPRYNKLIRLENTEFDALVNVYRERQVTDTGSDGGHITDTLTKGTKTVHNSSDTTTRTPELDTTTTREPDLTVTNTRLPNLTVENKNVTNSKNTTQGHSNSHGFNETNGHNGTKAVSKQNPQSISYGSSVAGEIPDLDWSYPSSQQQNYSDNFSHTNNESHSGSSTTSEVHGGSTDNQTTKGSDKNTQVTNGEDVTTVEERGTDTTVKVVNEGTSHTGSDVNVKEINTSSSNLKREIFTGRDNLTPQDALREAMSYVKQSSAFAWLKEQLEVCFLSVYDI